MGYSGGKLLRCKGVDIAKVFKKLNEVRGQLCRKQREGGGGGLLVKLLRRQCLLKGLHCRVKNLGTGERSM